MTPRLKLTLFGAPLVTLDEVPLIGALTGKLLALFIYLAVTGSVHRREALADLFWSELPPAQRRSNLRYLLADLRQLVGDYLLITPQTVSFNRQASYWLDVEVVRATLGGAAPYVTAADITAARALYQGEFLAGLRVRNAPAFMQWVAEQRQELQALLAQTPQPALDNLPKHNLPGQLTPFFGREAELADILTHLSQDDYRLLTIIGEGGVGKTRLALAVAQAILDFRFEILDSPPEDVENQKSKIKNQKFPDGVWFVPLVELAATPDVIDQLAMAIAKALDLPLAGQGEPSLQVCHFLTHKALLLVLDNFEQLADQADFLLPLLQNCSGLRLLITSRRQLNLQAEYPWRLTGLPLPALSQAPNLTATELGSYAGVALFVERARRAFPQFQLTVENQAAVVAICHLLEGLPLGLELAAALCKEYSCTELLPILQADYTMLAAGLPDLPPRHRSIRGALDHSWRLLDQETANTLAACAIFQGSFILAAAAAVTGANAATLQRLVDHSLLRLHHIETGERRYDLHDLVRHYAQEQLMALPTRYQQVQIAHAAYYLAQIERVALLLLQQGGYQAIIHRDLENITAAWQHSVAMGRFDLLAQSIEGLANFYRVAGLYSAAYQLFQPALAPVRQAMIDHDLAPGLLAALLINLSEFCRYLDQLSEAEAFAHEALTLGRQGADAVIESRACQKLARLAQRRAQYTIMRQHAEQACTLAYQCGNGRLWTMSLNTLGVAHLLTGDLAGAARYYQTALDCLRQERDHKLEAVILTNLGGVSIRRRDYATAIPYLEQAVTLAHALHDRHGAAVASTLLGTLWLDVGAFERAQAAYTEALRLLTEIRDPYWESWSYAGQAFLWHLEGNHAAAAQACGQTLALAQNKMPLFEHLALTYLGDVRWAQGDVATGEALYRRALAIQREASLHFRLAEPLFRLALLLLERNDGFAAQALLEEPLQQISTEGYAVFADPFGVYYAGYRVLQANGDPRADLILPQAQHLFEDALAKITDPALRQSFLTMIPWRRALWALIEAQFEHS